MNHEIYYIYTPAWVNWSAGIRVLHYLCDELNNAGFSAFLVIHGSNVKPVTSSVLNTPELTKEIAKLHKSEGQRVIAVYPETILGNPLNAPYVIRWILNYSSLLAGNSVFKNEKIIAYTNRLAEDYSLKSGAKPEVMFIPAIKSAEINNVQKNQIVKKKDLHVVYAQKYRALGGTPKTDYQSFEEITRFGKDAPSRDKTLSLIREASIFHAYENTTAISEACLLGTPVFCHKNEFFSELIASEELPFSGISWSEDEMQQPDIVGNLAILKEAEKNTGARLKEIFNNLDFDLATTTSGVVKIPRRGLMTKHSFSRGFQVLTQKGPIVFLRFLKNYIGR